MLICQALRRSAQIMSPQIFWVAAARRNLGTIRCAKCLELRLAKGWNDQVSHYGGGGTDRGIRNVQEQNG